MNDIDLLLKGMTNEVSATRKEEFKKRLSVEINRLINEDFSSVLQLLYRVDVDESKLRELLLQHPTTDAATNIADLLIERHIQKLASKEKFKKRDDIPDEEKW